MRVRDIITAQRLSVDEAYERFFDGYYNLGQPGEIFERTVVLSPPPSPPARPSRRNGRTRRSGEVARTGKRASGRK